MKHILKLSAIKTIYLTNENIYSSGGIAPLTNSNKMKNFIMVLLTALLTFGFITMVFFSSTSFIGIGEKIEFATMDREFQFTCMPAKGRDYRMMLRNFEEFKLENESPDLKLFRMTSKNYLNVRSWCRYKTMLEWNHEYLPYWKR